MTRVDAIAAARRDYAAALGTIIRPDCVTGYRGSDSVDVQTDGQVTVEVIETLDSDVLHDTGGFIDPYWNIAVVSDPKGLLAGVESCWCFGPSHEYSANEKV